MARETGGELGKKSDVTKVKEVEHFQKEEFFLIFHI